MTYWGEEYLLSGMDVFHLFLDKHSQEQGGSPNICSVVLEFRTPVETQALTKKILEHDTLTFLRSLVLSPTPVFSWEVQNSSTLDNPPLKVITDVLSPVSSCSPTMPFIVEGISTTAKAPHEITGLRISWHHALMDARRAEQLLLGLTTPLPKEMLFSKARQQTKDKETCAVQELLQRKFKGPFVTLSPQSSCAVCPRYSTLRLSKVQQKITTTEERYHLTYYPSLLYLAAAVWSFNRCFPQKEKLPLVVPVPMDDRRRKGSPLLGNSLSVIPFRIEHEALQDFSALVTSLCTQMEEYIYGTYHRLFVAAMEQWASLPFELFSALISSPTGGAMATLYYSDVGDSLSALTHFLGEEVSQAYHIPPHLLPVPLTLISFRGEKDPKVILRTDPKRVSDEEHTRFLTFFLETLTS